MKNCNRTGLVWWGISLVYILFTYATLGIMPSIWRMLNSALGGKGLFIQYLIYSLIGISVPAYMYFIKKDKSVFNYMLFCIFTIIFFIMVRFEKNPGEKIHMGQYGLFGVLLYNALKSSFNRFDKRIYLYGSLISVVAGVLDEIIQGLLPNRFFTWHDVFINGISGVIALLIIRFCILKRLYHG